MVSWSYLFPPPHVTTFCRAEADAGKLKEELADVLAYAFMLADKYDLDVAQIMRDKLEKNNLKYPVAKARGSAKKYTDL